MVARQLYSSDIISERDFLFQLKHLSFSKLSKCASREYIKYTYAYLQYGHVVIARDFVETRMNDDFIDLVHFSTFVVARRADSHVELRKASPAIFLKDVSTVQYVRKTRRSYSSYYYTDIVRIISKFTLGRTERT